MFYPAATDLKRTYFVSSRAEIFAFFIFISILVGILSSCISAVVANDKGDGLPGWYIDVNNVYPRQDYLAARGKGSTEREAKRDAAGELATLFLSKVDYKSTANFRYSESADSNHSSRKVAQTVRVHSNQDIAGIEYSEPFRPKGKGQVFVVAYLEREKIGKLYSERITQRRDKIEELRRRGRNLSPEDSNIKNLLSGFIFYDYSVEQALRNEPLLEQLQIINKSMHNRIFRTIDYNSVRLAEERDKFARGLSFSVNYGGDEELNFLGESIAEEFTKLGFPRRENSNTALTVVLDLKLSDIPSNNRYTNLGWEILIRFTHAQSLEENGAQTALLNFSKAGRESGLSRARALLTLKRLLDKQLKDEFMSQVYTYFAKLAGI